ncbi:MAG: glycosyltransferase, partial [Planctomycetota bacterium]
MAPHPPCSIAIVYFRTPRQIRLCLRALRRHTATGGDLEVIVVDNGSGPGDPGLAWLRTLGWIRLLERNDAFPS